MFRFRLKITQKYICITSRILISLGPQHVSVYIFSLSSSYITIVHRIKMVLSISRLYKCFPRIEPSCWNGIPNYCTIHTDELQCFISMQQASVKLAGSQACQRVCLPHNFFSVLWDPVTRSLSSCLCRA